MTDQNVWIRVARPTIASGRVTTVVAGDRAVCVVHREDGTWSALDNRCPHQGGPLGGTAFGALTPRSSTGTLDDAVTFFSEGPSHLSE